VKQLQSKKSNPYQIFFKKKLYQKWTPPKGAVRRFDVIALVARVFIRWASGNIYDLTHDLVPKVAQRLLSGKKINPKISLGLLLVPQGFQNRSFG
jgi:hypothetical protein